MGTWVLNGTTVNLQDNSHTVAIGSDATPPGRKLAVAGTARASLEDHGGQVYNVKAYGAAGDGATDDRRAVQNAINAAEAAASGIVYFPPGIYLLGASTQPDLLTFTRPMQFLGAGPFLSVITTDQATQNIFHSTVTVTDVHDKVRPVIFRDLKIEASVKRTAGAAILQDVPAGSRFQHGIRIENCHFKGQWVAVHLTGASTAVIENCTFWASIEGPAPTTEADVWIDERTGFDSTTHLITGCLFADSLGTCGKAVKITGHAGGDRIIGNLFVNYDTQIHFEVDGPGTSQIVEGNVMEGARVAAIRITGATHQVHSVISGNTINVFGTSGLPRRGVWADPAGAGAVASMITVVGNKLAGDPVGGRGIELAPGAGAVTDRWLVAENLFVAFKTAIQLGPGVTGFMLGNNGYTGNGVNLENNSTGSRGAAFLDRVGIGTENSVTAHKELHIRSTQPLRPRIYLEGLAGTSSPGVEFAFDAANTRRAAIVGTASGSSGVQLELFTKPDTGGVAQRLIVDKDGNALWRSPNFQEMVSVGLEPPPPTPGRGRVFMRDTGSGKTQLCVKFATGPVQVLATEP
jgi:hypothetical protein